MRAAWTQAARMNLSKLPFFHCLRTTDLRVASSPVGAVERTRDFLLRVRAVRRASRRQGPLQQLNHALYRLHLTLGYRASGRSAHGWLPSMAWAIGCAFSIFVTSDITALAYESH